MEGSLDVLDYNAQKFLSARATQSKLLEGAIMGKALLYAAHLLKCTTMDIHPLSVGPFGSDMTPSNRLDKALQFAW